MARVLLFILLFLPSLRSAAQDSKRLAELRNRVSTASSDLKRIESLAALAEYYSIFNLQNAADSALEKALFLAEMSQDQDILSFVLFNKTVTNLYPWSNESDFQNSRHFIETALKHAQDAKRNDLAAIAYIRLSMLLRKKRLADEALQQATLAFTALAEREPDSLHAVLYAELGDIYMLKADPVTAFRNYNTAFEIAYRKKIIPLQVEMLFRYSELYKTYDNDETAKEYLTQSLGISNDNGYAEGQFKSLIHLARITDKKEYIEEAAEIATKIGSDQYKLTAKRLMFYWYMVRGKNSQHTLDYLQGNSDLLSFFLNTGPGNYHREMGNLFRYSGILDSALYYYKIAESEFNKSSAPSLVVPLKMEMGETYFGLGDIGMAEKCFTLCYGSSRESGDVRTVAEVSDKLQALYASTRNFENAYYYARQYDSANVVINAKAKDDKFLLLRLEQESRKRENDLASQKAETDRKHNLQIMGITVTITLFFGLMLILGMFAVSRTMIRVMGYFAFICLFEFIILLLDHPIVEVTHGEPVKIWGIKIALIAMLVPLQHFLEHRLINFLASRQLLKARQNFSIKKWFSRTKPSPTSGPEFEEDTAVL